MKNIKDKDLELVSGGTQEEIDQIIALFRKHGCQLLPIKIGSLGI